MIRHYSKRISSLVADEFCCLNAGFKTPCNICPILHHSKKNNEKNVNEKDNNKKQNPFFFTSNVCY